MEVRCPFNPKHTVRINEPRCQVCDRAITIPELFKCYKRRVQWSFLTECPKCECVAPLGANQCERCKTSVTVTRFACFAFQFFWSAWLRRANGISVNTIRVFQRFYLAFSLVFLWGSVSFVATAHVESLLGEVVIAIVFLIAAMVLARVLIPAETLASIRDKTSGIVKFALFVNLVTSVPLLVIVSGVWKAQIAIIAGILGVLVIAAWVFCGIAWPLASDVYRIFFGENSTTPDPLARQGRTPRYD